jgi:hypothetical protein
LPIYLDPEVREYLTARAKDKGVEVNRLVIFFFIAPPTLEGAMMAGRHR